MLQLFKINRGVEIGRLYFECDYHTHLLPGVDDGRFDMIQARETIIAMSQAGVKKICLTPHIAMGIHNNSEKGLKEAFDKFVKELDLPQTTTDKLQLAAEYMVDENFLARIQTPEGVNELLNPEPSKVLIEMSYLHISPQIEDTIFRFALHGITPVLAHPERYRYLYGSPKKYNRLADMGAEFQLNLLSATGLYGKATVKAMEYIMSEGLYKHVGSDVHSNFQYNNAQLTKINAKIAKMGVECGLWRII